MRQDTRRRRTPSSRRFWALLVVVAILLSVFLPVAKAVAAPVGPIPVPPGSGMYVPPTEVEQEPEGWVTKAVAGLINSVRAVFVKLGLTPFSVLVFNRPENPDDVLPDLSYGIFTTREAQAVNTLWLGFFGLMMGVFVVLAAGVTGLKLASATDDPRKRSDAMEQLKRLGSSALLMVFSGLIIWVMFSANELIVEAVARISPKHSFSEFFAGDGMGVLGTALVRIVGTWIEITLNIVYIMRKFGLMVLVAVSPIVFYLYIFESTRNVLTIWFQEIISNLLIQPIHAILIALFFFAYHGAGAGSALAAIGFLLVLQPTTNMLRSVLTGGRFSFFTGMAQGAAMLGLGTALGVTRSIGRLGGTNFASLGVGLGGRVGAVGGRLGAVGGAAAGLAGAVGLDGVGDKPVNQARAYAPTVNANLAKAARATELGATVLGHAGRFVGAMAGGGLALASGDASYIETGAALGGKVGRRTGAFVAGAASQTWAAAKEAGGAEGVITGAKEAATSVAGTTFSRLAGGKEGEKGFRRNLSVSAAAVAAGAVAGGAALYGASRVLARGARNLYGSAQKGLTEHEQKEAFRVNLAGAMGDVIGGHRGRAAFQGAAAYINRVERSRRGLPQMGEAISDPGKYFEEGQRVRFEQFPNCTHVKVQDTDGSWVKVDHTCDGNEFTSWDQPHVEDVIFKNGRFEPYKGDDTPHVQHSYAHGRPSPRTGIKGRTGHARGRVI